MRHALPLLLAATLLATGGCATSPAASGANGTSGGAGANGASGGPAASRRSAGTNTLLASEITAAAQENLRDLVVSLRPRWVQNNSAGSIGSGGANAGVAVFINGQMGGGIDALAQIPKRAVERITFYSTTEAQARYGSRVRGPVIDVRLQTGG